MPSKIHNSKKILRQTQRAHLISHEVVSRPALVSRRKDAVLSVLRTLATRKVWLGLPSCP